jgi:hypothetical protein
MTALSKRKTRLCVEFSDAVRERGRSREVVAELTPYCIRVKLKGMRTVFEVSPAGVYNFAVQRAVIAARAEKKARKTK